MTRIQRIALLFVLFLLPNIAAFAQDAAAAAAPKIDTGDTAWMLASAALVLFMTIPGLFLFYGGLVRSKNVLGMFMQNFMMVGIITIQWIVIGYSLAFSSGSSFLGGLQWMGLSGVGAVPNADYAATIPHQTFMFYQLMFAIITPALMTGAFAERMKFTRS
jgi:Amt family ammonium transporter